MKLGAFEIRGLRDLLNGKLAKALPLRLRIAWAASVTERAIRLLPSSFIRSYRQANWLDHAWSFALDGRSDDSARMRLIDASGELIQRAEQDGFLGMNVMIGGLVLEEIEANDGRSACTAVEYASYTYVAHILDALGRDQAKEAVESLDLLHLPFLGFALQMLEDARTVPVVRIDRAMFDELELPGVGPASARRRRISTRTPRAAAAKKKAAKKRKKRD